MITKRLFSLLCSVGVAAFMAASCQAPALEEIQELAQTAKYYQSKL